MGSVIPFEDRTAQYAVQYERAVEALKLAREALSLDGLEIVDVSIAALQARGRIVEDVRAKQAAKDLEFEKYSVAAFIAQKLIERDKPFSLAGRGKNVKAPLGIAGVLKRAGWKNTDARAAAHIAYLTEPQLKKVRASKNSLKITLKHTPNPLNMRKRVRSDAWNKLFSTSGSAGSIYLGTVTAPMQRVPAKQVAEEFDDSEEIILARRSVQQVRDWCDAFLKALPKVRP